MSETVLVERQTDARHINAILNDPAVRPWVADASEGRIDISEKVANGKNFLLAGEHGACFFAHLLPGVYEVHTQVLPRARGRWARGMMEASVRWMFTRTDCFEITTRVPGGHVAAKAAALSMGLRHEFTRPNECRFRGKVVDVDILSYRVQDWVGRDDTMTEIGRWFHGRLHAEAARLGVTAPAHEDDPNHNRYVGASFEMARCGQPVKATILYNRWALCARHAPVQLLSVDPVTIKFDIGILTIKDGDIEVSRGC